MTGHRPWEHDWPRRDEARVAQPEVPRHRSRKNTRRWCRGKVGVEHDRATRVSRNVTYRLTRDPTSRVCYRPEWYPTSWWCNHEHYCTVCGKILRWSLGEDCPDFTVEVTRRPSLRRRLRNETEIEEGDDAT